MLNCLILWTIQVAALFNPQEMERCIPRSEDFSDRNDELMIPHWPQIAESESTPALSQESPVFLDDDLTASSDRSRRANTEEPLSSIEPGELVEKEGFNIQPVNSNELTIQDRINRASCGDYLVVEGGKMINIVSVCSVTPSSVVFEEVSIPSQNLKRRPSSWNEWIKEKAPGHTSWSMIELDRLTGEVIECYSFTRSSWLQISSHESLLATLLSLPLEPIALDKRRKIGPPPPPGDIDTRKIWNPPALFEGKKQEKVVFDVYQATWPQDQSPLSGNTVVLYFDQAGKFPFPFWIQVETTHANIALRTIDTGKNFPSPYRKFPKRIPQLIGEPQKSKSGLRLSLKSPKYFRHFNLFAIDVTTRERELCPITYALYEGKEEFLTIEIQEEELNQALKPDHRYTWLVVPEGHSESYTESIKPFTWRVRHY